MSKLSHIAYCIRTAARRPRIALNGVREYRTDLTTHYDNLDELDSYDAGRELAHIATLRRFDPAVY